MDQHGTQLLLQIPMWMEQQHSMSRVRTHLEGMCAQSQCERVLKQAKFQCGEEMGKIIQGKVSGTNMLTNTKSCGWLLFCTRPYLRGVLMNT